MDIFISLW